VQGIETHTERQPDAILALAQSEGVVVDRVALRVFGRQVHLGDLAGLKIAGDLDDDAGVWGVVAVAAEGEQQPERQHGDRKTGTGKRSHFAFTPEVAAQSEQKLPLPPRVANSAPVTPPATTTPTAVQNHQRWKSDVSAVASGGVLLAG
jgi:hypothetical protein